MIRICNRCGNSHVRCLMFAPLGWRVLFCNQVEETWEEDVLFFQARNQLPLVKVRTSSVLEFVANWFV